MISGLRLVVAVSSLVVAASCLECRKIENGGFEIFNGEEVVSPTSFDCMAIIKPGQTTVHVTYLKKDDEGRKVCQISEDGIAKDKKIYARSAVPTGTKCEYLCKDSEGRYKCDTVTSPEDNACTCHPAPPRLVIHPLSSISGQGEEETEDDSCADKPAGYQFPDPVDCSSMQADITKLRIDFLKDQTDRCSAVVTTKTETRYTQASPNGINLQGCLFVCKPAGPKCTAEIEDKECDCKSPGLTKRLVPMDNIAVRDLLVQKKCTPGNCGPCGECNEKTSNCDLVKDAHQRNRCDCGEICPQSDNRAEEHKGGKILCKPNLALDCMKKPGWLTSQFNVPQPGTKYPNMCTDGPEDAADTCSCAPGYIEKPGPFSAVYCVKNVE